MKKIWSLENFFLVLGAFLCATSVNIWAIPNQLSEGGIFGLSMLLYYIFGIAPSLSNMVLNGILIIIGWRFVGQKTMIRTIFVIIMTSIFLRLLAPYGVVFHNTVIASLATGLFMGTGVGLVYQGNGTTAGSTIIANIMDRYFSIPKSKTIFAIDLLVVIPAAFVIGLERMFLTLMAVFISVKAIEYIIEGAHPRKSVMIISAQYEAIAYGLEQAVDRGITYLESEGYYSRQSMKIVFTIIEPEELLEVSRIVEEIDPKAFMIVNDVQNVFGSGFDQMMVRDKKKKLMLHPKKK